MIPIIGYVLNFFSLICFLYVMGYVAGEEKNMTDSQKSSILFFVALFVLSCFIPYLTFTLIIGALVFGLGMGAGEK